MVRIKNESDILNDGIRRQIIEEINGQENRLRKDEAYKRYQCLKDKTNRYVIELLLAQFDISTMREMKYSISNISLTRKCIEKLARVYANGCTRLISDDDEATRKLESLARALNFNTEIKKTNKFLKLQKNIALYSKPCPVGDKYTLKLEALNPYLYDVIEDYYDRTKPMVFILSDYQPGPDMSYVVDGIPQPRVIGEGDKKDQVIADSPIDQNAGCMKTYIFWSDNYHFTCDQNGTILPNETENLNPFGVCPLVNFAIDQDGSFWAQGGNDLIDGSILVNAIISHINHVGVVQGYGQFYMTGENLPRSVKVGPSKAIIAEYKKDEQAEPKMGFLNANPQLDSLRGLVEMYVALLLTTNNLSTNGVSTQLSGGVALASGVAMILDKAESLEDVNDQRQLFIDKEPQLFKVVNAQLKHYGDTLLENLKGLELPENFGEKFSLKFNDQQAILTEKEKLENLKARYELGIDSMLSLLKKDDPSLTDDQAEAKLKKLLEEKIKENMIRQEVGAENGAPEMVPNDQTPQDSTNLPDHVSPDATGKLATAQGVDVQKTALNGAQVTSMVDVVEKVALGQIPRDAGKNILISGFMIDDVEAEKVLGTAGKGFQPAQAPAAPAPVKLDTGLINGN